MAPLNDLFDKVITLIQTTPVTKDLAISNEDKLRLYGLYKQVIEGPCPEGTAPPPLWKPIDRAKYEAWVSYRHLDTNEAMLKYVRVAAEQNHWLGHQCRALLQEYEHQVIGVGRNDGKVRDGNINASNEMLCEDPSELLELPSRQAIPPPQNLAPPRLVERIFGLKPIVPRGQLDVSFGELAAAARFCLDIPSSLKRNSCEAEICGVWKQMSQEVGEQPNDREIIVGLSARSLLDLYLRAKTFLPGSEVIVTPPINIPAMIAILEYHGLVVVPVDLPESFAIDRVLRVDLDEVGRVVTTTTAAIMLVHPFGIETIIESDMEHLRALADKHGFDIIEDCAECYSGARSTSRPHADLTLFSFGTIKTATALGGGVAVLRSSQLSTKMKRLHQSLYESQTQTEFFWKVIKAVLIRIVATSPNLYAVIALSCRCLRFDFDHVVSSSVRNFSSKQQDVQIGRIRRRPSLALLKMLEIRIRSYRQTESSLQTKIEQCEKMMSLLHISPVVKWPKAVATHSWWLAPIMVPTPDKTSLRLLHLGYDVPRGLSQLQCIGCCPRAQTLMQSILYLPVASRSMTGSEMSSLAHAISFAADPQTLGNAKPKTTVPGLCTTAAIACLVVSFLLRTQQINVTIQFFISICSLALSLFLLKIVLSAILTFFIADVYLESSGCFAKHNPMLRQIFEPNRKRSETHQAAINDIPSILLNTFSSVDSRKPSIILTGATGFLGSNILYQLLTNRDLSKSIDRIVLICRPKHGKSVAERVDELLSREIFSFLATEDLEDRFLILEGDISQPDAGLSQCSLAALCSDLKVQCVVNCAASVRFNQSLDDAAASNITSALYLQKLSQGLCAKFVHISTAFVHGNLTGTKASPLTETLFALGKYDAGKIYKSMTGNQMYASLAMSSLGFHNTYTFSKCICEHLLLQFNSDNLIIIRPSIIGPAIQEPFEGWAGQKPSTIVAATCLYMKFPFSVWSFGKHEAAVIPVDVVARFILAKALVSHGSPSIGCLGDRSECSSPCSSEYEKIPPIGEVESLSSGSQSSTVVVPMRFGESIPSIFNAAWNSDSPICTTFSWFDFATSVPHLGTVLGDCTRVTAYVGFAVSVKILPSFGLKTKQFAALYYLLVQIPLTALVWLSKFLALRTLHQELSRLLPFLDLPILFYPFANNSFFFDSTLHAPLNLDGDRYMFSCIAAAHRFLFESSTGKYKKMNLRDTSNVLVGGKELQLPIIDLQWAMTQPRGNVVVRLAAYLFVKLLRSSCTAVTVDVESFAEIARNTTGNDKLHVILAPTHRSFYDFILVSFIAFSLPELRIQLPHIAAAYEFSNLPFVGCILEYMNAFFVKRDRGRDPDLVNQLMAIKSVAKGCGTCIEVFIEGSRSRDRRFLQPKTGLLRCLVQTGGNHLVVPVCINYEKIPEQDALVREGIEGTKRGLRITGLIPWLWDTLNGKLPLGKIHIAAGKPILLDKDTDTDIKFDRLASEIQNRQQALLFISPYHVKGAELLLKLDYAVIAEALHHLGCKFWPTTSPSSVSPEIFAPTSISESWSIMMQFAHLITPHLKESHSFWANWLCPFELLSSSCVDKPDSVTRLVNSFVEMFDRAEHAVNLAVQELNDIGICRLSREHVVHVAKRNQTDTIPDELLHAYASMKVINDYPPVQIDSLPPRSLDAGNEHEDLGMWGFKDSRFKVRPDANGNPTVVMSGSRYGISGKPLRKLVPFIEAETKTIVEVYKEPVAVIGLDVNRCDLSDDDIKSITSIVSRISLAPGTRTRHGIGHSQAEAYQLRQNCNVRVPDIVVWPSNESEIEILIRMAKERSWNLIPHGGGTNVSQATKCPSKSADSRPVVSVDMTELKSILYVNEEDGLAHVQAGITGRELVDQMRRRGYTIGHEPDSLEFSTLGGWIATKASGMKRSKYGNIEDIVVDIRVAAAGGPVWQGNSVHGSTAPGRQSRGPDLLSLFLGSEGCLGIITSAVIRIWPLPPVHQYDSVLFADFRTGLEFAQSVSKLGPFMPASVRLLDNAHFRLGQALREDASFLESVGAAVWHLASSTLRSMSSKTMVCATLSFEGSHDEVREQKRQIKKLVNRHGGLSLGSNVGRSGYELTYVIAYLRDFALSYNYLGDSFETFAPWSKVQEVITATKSKVIEEHKRRLLPGEVFVGCRVTQLYHDGACIYFYVCMFSGTVDDASCVFSEIENSARQEILRHGGSLSHHHGVGKIRNEFLRTMDSKAFRESVLAVKNGLDPTNTFGAGNGFFGSFM